MKLTCVRTAKSIWLFPLLDINPRGRHLVPAVAAIMARYEFLKGPDMNALVANPIKIAFEAGAFQGPKGSPLAVDLTLHDDGIVAENRRSTADGDLFLEDLLSWISREYDLPCYAELGIRRAYASELSVQFTHSVSIFSEKFKKFASTLSGKVGPQSAQPIELAHLNFGVDMLTLNNTQPLLLRIEREAGTPYGENRYYSYAPIKTEEHLELLKRFEMSSS